MNYSLLLKKLVARQNLSGKEAFEAVTAILAGELTEGQIGGFLATLAAKGETIDEIAAGAQAMRAAATRVQSLNANTLDTVGTGGDGGMTFNISTTRTLVGGGRRRHRRQTRQPRQLRQERQRGLPGATRA